MATKRRPKSMYDPVQDESDLFLDTLTRDEKEAMLNKKMEEIRRKNEALQRRHAEIEADKKKAEDKGYAVSLKTPPQEETENVKQEKSPMRGVKVTVEDDALKPVSRFSAGRGKRLAKMKGEAIKAQKQEQSKSKIVGDSKPGQSKITGDKRQSERNLLHDTPPPETGRNFLADERRQGAFADNSKNFSSRNRHSYGGSDFNNVKSQMQQERQKQRYEKPPVSKQEMELCMTGRERREYSNWKQEREQIDHDRLHRQKNTEGSWRREWDSDKKDRGDAPPTPPPSRHLEPGRRPAGRIGSGRFSSGDEKSPKGNDNSPSKGPSVREPDRDYNTKGFQSGREQFRQSSAEDDTTTQRHSKGYEAHDNRHVQEKQDTLVIQVLNDFSGQGLDGKRGSRGSGGPRGRGERSRGRGWAENSRGARSDSRGGWGENRGGRGGRGRGDCSSRGDYVGRGYSRGDGRRGDYHQNMGDYRGRGTRGGRGGDNRSYRDDGFGYSRGRDNRGGRGGNRGGRGREPPRHRYEEEPQIIGTVVIDTTPSAVATMVETTSSRRSPPIKSGSLEPSGPLSPHSDKSWETTEGEWTSDSQGDVWETEEEEVMGGKEGNNDDNADDFANDEDQYEEDDYWEEGLELQGTHDTNLAIEEYHLEDQQDFQNGEEDDHTAPEKDEEEEDAHNSSSESLDRFIQQHTLHLNIKTGNLVTAESLENPVEGTTTPDKSAASSSNNSVLSPLTPMKTPEGHVHVLNWAAEMSTDESPKKAENLSMNTTVNSSDLNDSPDKRTDIDEHVKDESVSDVVRNLDSDMKDIETVSKDQNSDVEKSCSGEVAATDDNDEVAKKHENQVPNEQNCEADIETRATFDVKEESVSEFTEESGNICEAGLIPGADSKEDVRSESDCTTSEGHQNDENVNGSEQEHASADPSVEVLSEDKESCSLQKTIQPSNEDLCTPSS